MYITIILAFWTPLHGTTKSVLVTIIVRCPHFRGTHLYCKWDLHETAIREVSFACNHGPCICIVES